MEVRQERVGPLELEAGRDEQIGAAGGGPPRASVSSTRTVVVPTANTLGAAEMRSQASADTS